MTSAYIKRILLKHFINPPVLILVIAVMVRIYRLDLLANFSLEQSLALSGAASMIEQGKPSLVGVEYFIRQTSVGHSFFNSGFYLYPFVLIQILFGYDPIYPTIFMVFLNLLAGVVLYSLTEKFINQKAAIITLLLFSLNPSMIEYSRMVWHIGFLMPITASVLWMILSWRQKQFHPLMLGFLLGLGTGIHISFSLFSLLSVLLLIYFSGKGMRVRLSMLIPGFLLGLSPLILFDLRHEFYLARTFINYLSELLAGRVGGSPLVAEPYYFHIYLLPLFILAGYFLAKLAKKQIILTLLIVGVYIYVTFPALGLFSTHPQGMPEGLSLPVIRNISQIISDENPDNYNIASLVGGDNRAMNIRYFLSFVHKNPPQGYDQYPQAKSLFVVSSPGEEILGSQIYEISSARPSSVSKTWKINDNIILTRLDKLND